MIYNYQVAITFLIGAILFSIIVLIINKKNKSKEKKEDD